MPLLLHREDKLKRYIERLKHDGIGPDGITTKIERLGRALEYCRREKLLRSQDCQPVIDRLAAWKHPFARQKPALQAERSLLDDATKDQERLDTVNSFFTNETLQSALTTIKRKSKNFTSEDLAIVSTYLFCSLVYRNWQRPGAAINLKTHEAAGAVERDGHIVVHSSQHKTALAHGPAVMVLPREDVAIFLHYRDVMRPNIAGSSAAEDSNIFLLNSHYRPLINYRDTVKSISRKFNLPALSTATAVRKAGATMMVGSNPTREALEDMAEHMAHTTVTSEKIYRHRQRHVKAVATFEKIQSVSSKLANTLNH